MSGGVAFKRSATRMPVRHEALGNLVEISNSGVDKKSVDGELPVRLLNYMDVYRNRHIESSTISASTTASFSKLATCSLRKGDVVITPTSESVDDLAHAAVVAEDLPDVVYSYHVMRLRMRGAGLDPGFLAYLFRSAPVQEQIRLFVAGITRFGLTRPKWNSLVVPVPDLELQREIVRALDHFRGLQSELENELEARRRQYASYRDQLVLSGAGSGSLRMLGELATVARGASPRPIQEYLTDDPQGIPWIKIGDVPVGEKFITRTAQRVTKAGAAKSRRVYPGDFVLSNSMSFGRPYISKVEGCIHDGWLAISNFGEHFLPDYLYHLLSSTPIQNDFARRVGSSTVSNLNSETVKATLLSVPTLEEQLKIVKVLDQFDALINDPHIGLPAELAARRKQYEYYRDKLLTFEEATA